MKLYHDKDAPSPRRARIFLAEKGIEIPTVYADITALCALEFINIIGRGIGDDTPNLQRWHAAVAERPSCRA